ncbi:NAD(P)H-hydrate dehydratase [Blattabacterium cuenoti]|uniref:NAD(P)H-hydrate dehydratase n=1 Tax=Blattabacterium cuenoti TaxID=1653831 RepID=UPI00163D3B9B|nr:NAD(P)H-hydrate dehydratase [Blattabacterium cuenoti]
MKILSLKQIKQADKNCIQSESISHFELMKRAAKKCFDWIKNSKFIKYKKYPFIILAGNGNNGGDGMALAELLYINGLKPSVYIINISNHYSNEFILNKNNLLNYYKIKIHNIYENDYFPILNKKSYLIDAILGIGLNRPITKYWQSFFHFINKKKFLSVLSIDIPSGIFIEKNIEFSSNSIIKSDHVLSFQIPKLPFLLPDYENFINNWHLLDIGWKKKFIDKKIYCKYFFIEKKDVSFLKKKRKKFSHKGNYGHGLIIGGSYGMIGSIILAGKASFRSGIGKLSIYVPYCGYDIIQNNVFEAIVKTDKKKNYISNITITDIDKINAIGIGMGLGIHSNTINSFIKFLYKIKENLIPAVIDADAINILSIKKYLLNLLPSNTILTPHPKEFKNLFGSWNNDYQKLYLLKKYSKKYKIFIVLKGAYTIISTPDEELYFNSTGNPGMATAGSGDVLTGIIVSLLSQGYSSIESCIIGVYLHGLSGDIASKKLGEESINSTDIIHYLTEAFQKI